MALAACSSQTPTATPGSSAPADPSPGATKPAATMQPNADASEATQPPDGDATTAPTAQPEQPPQPSAVEPPSPGTYNYTQDGTTKAGAFTFEDDVQGTLDVEAADGARQRQTRSYSDQNSVEQTLRFTAGGVYVTRFVSRFFTSTMTCALDSPLLVIRNTTEPGSSWKDQGTCDGRSVVAKGTLLKAERRTVGGATVDTLKVRLTLTIEGGGLDQTSETTAWVAPDHRLIVRSISHAEGTADGQSFTQDRTEDLVSLTPA